MAKSSWRFLFVDINESITITEQDTKWIAYLAGRFPKGNLKADFIAPDNGAMIKAMFGYPSADWSDVYEAIELNKEFGLYISANPGTSSDIPNYYGGYYQTSLGYMKMYCNTSKEDPNFLVSIRPNEFTDKLKLSTASNEKVTTVLNEAGKSAVITISGIPTKLIKNTSEIAFDYWNQKKAFRYSLDKSTGLIHPSSESVKDEEGQKITCGTFSLVTDESTGETTYTVNLGADTSLDATVKNWNTASDETTYGIPFIDFTKYGSGVYDYSAYYGDDFASWASTDNAKDITSAILNGGEADDVGAALVKLSYSEGLAKKIRFLFNCEDITKCWVVQKSPTAQDTEFTFTDVIYDKYKYDEVLPYAVGSTIDEAFTYTTESTVVGDDGVETVEKTSHVLSSKAEFSKLLTEGDFSDFVNADYTIMLLNGKTADQKIYQYKDADEDEGIKEGWYDITEEYSTKRIIAVNNVQPIQQDTDGTYNHNIYRAIVDDNDNAYIDQMTETNTNEDLVLTVNPSYNTFTFEATEEDEEGEIHSSGAFEGSLDETALNENGSECFFEEIFPVDSATYAELHVLDTFDDDLDEKGYYTGYRFGDTSVTSNGQRYMNSLIAENIANGNTGSNCSDASTKLRKQFARVAKASMEEACGPKYEDARVFVECTGLDSVKDTFASVRKAHAMSLIVSAKLIDENTFKKVSSMTVAGRCRGSIQYCQELQFKDKNTRKKYYATPVGAMAAMIMTIKRDALGALQADWINNQGMGGQIDDFFVDRTPKKARWDFTDEDTKIMDTKGINPILMDVEDGVMAVSSVTTELDAGDWSEIGHCSAFDECKREIRDKVMKPQIEKKINDYWISKREEDAQEIVNKWTSGGDSAWAVGEVDCTNCNNEYSKAQKIFNIKVKVRVHPFSKWVKLTFTNLSQITTVTEE